MADGQKQHHLPQVYLRQWCESGPLVRYRRVGPRGKLVADNKYPEGIGWERDLYDLPVGFNIDGRRDDDLEMQLAQTVDARFSAIAGAAEEVSGPVHDARLAADLRWLLKAFAVRTPATLARLQEGVAALLSENREFMEQLLARAQTQESRDKLEGYLHADMPAAQSLSPLVALVGGREFGGGVWLAGDVHIVQTEAVLSSLSALGLTEFVTGEEPVIEWEQAELAPVATFSLSPRAMVLVARTTSPLPDFDVAATTHVSARLSYRRDVVCSRRVDAASEFHALMAERLRYWTDEAEA